MAKQRGRTHLSEDESELITRTLLPKEWVIRRFHPDYGVDLSIEVFEQTKNGVPTMGEFIFVQLKSSKNLKTTTIKIRERINVEKALDKGGGDEVVEIDVISMSIDVDIIDNARLMGPSTPLILFAVDLHKVEIYYICITDYYDKILEPKETPLKTQKTVTVHIPVTNKLSADNSKEMMRFYAARSKFYAMFNLAQFQYRETRYIFDTLYNCDDLPTVVRNIAIIERFARRLRGMPIWDRKLPWALLSHYRKRLDEIIAAIDAGELLKAAAKIVQEGDKMAIMLKPEYRILAYCERSWDQFSAMGQTFEDVVREWDLPTYMGQLSS